MFFGKFLEDDEANGKTAMRRRKKRREKEEEKLQALMLIEKLKAN